MVAAAHSPAMLQPPLTIRSSSAAYRVEFPEVASLEHWQPQADLLLVDDFFAGRLDPALAERQILIRADEAAKSFERMGELLLELKRRGLNRSSTLLGLGGGVIQDITTFVASVYMRGIPWTYVPSTFLAMADSCLGGKSSINVGPAKNLVGTFHPPRLITVMAPLARSLPLVELRGGLAEAAKICFCHGPASFRRYRQLAAPLLAGDWSDAELAALLHHVLEVKQWFIETDEFDRAERRLLNFGHTWGHALESATGYAVPHGPAVALGMRAAHRFMGRPQGSAELIAHTDALLEGVMTRELLAEFQPDLFLEAFRGDKKHGREHYHVIVPPAESDQLSLGVLERRLPRHPDQEAAVLRAMLEVIQEVPA
ncbi:MAG: 3-dehydroquinate synthase family protein [Synechococcaceae cyanobacterium]|nr:3-dehydroquinate synthase family protein [Synechococcaceae cyanobacterium]